VAVSYVQKLHNVRIGKAGISIQAVEPPEEVTLLVEMLSRLFLYFSAPSGRACQIDNNWEISSLKLAWQDDDHTIAYVMAEFANGINATVTVLYERKDHSAVLVEDSQFSYPVSAKMTEAWFNEFEAAAGPLSSEILTGTDGNCVRFTLTQVNVARLHAAVDLTDLLEETC
jgi:hypothetical protein